MRFKKKWLASLLTIAVVFGDCGGIPVSAEEAVPTAETSVSENNAKDTSPERKAESVPGETQDETDFPSDEVPVSESTSETELPALQIGQLKKGDPFPSGDDSDFTYGLPVSFENADSLVLFVNYQADALPDAEEYGTLVWSILCGEKGTPAGSASLMQEEDDWTGFETVGASPHFALSVNDDEESRFYQTLELSRETSADASVISAKTGDSRIPEAYDYYIRAAYYPENRTDPDGTFYAAATVPFLPQADTSTEEEQISEGIPDAEETSSDSMPGDISISGNTVDTVETEPPDDLTEEGTSETAKEQDPVDDKPIVKETVSEQIPKTAVSENSTTSRTTSSEPALPENGAAARQPAAESIGVLTLSAESITLHPDDSFSVNAVIAPKDETAVILWKSSDESVAAVVSSAQIDSAGHAAGENAVITAKAEGTAQITAACGDLSASVLVKVVPRDEDEVYDLSGELWVNGFQRESDAFVYTGQKITQDFRVYHKETLLKEKTDYTLSYKNNVNAAAWDSTKAPSVTINLKGHYSGSVTLFYTIRPVSLGDIDIYNKENPDGSASGSYGYEQAVTYGKNLKIPAPVLTFGRKTLKANKDFVCDYSTLPADYKKGDSYEPGKVYTYTVSGIGNFTGSIPMRLVVLKDKGQNFSSASVKLGARQYEYHGTALSKADVTVETMTLDGKVLDSSLYDYEVCAENPESAYVMVYPSTAGRDAGYRGFQKVNLKVIGDRDIKAAAVGTGWKDSIPFSQKTLDTQGGFFQEKTGVLTFGADPLTEGKDYTVKYRNAQKAGTATVTFTGKGRYKGSLQQKYVIAPNAEQRHFTFRWKNAVKEGDMLAVPYQKGGAMPDFVLKDQDGHVLKARTDYTVKYRDNKTPGKLMGCEITGRGNYKGYTETVQLLVTYGRIDRATLSVPDRPYSTRPESWKSAVRITDENGKKLAAGTDYEKDPVYTYANMENGQPPQAGTTIHVTVKGTGNYAGSVLSGSYRIFEKNISTLQVVIDSQEYTGKEITLSPKDIHVYANAADKKNHANELTLPCYEIMEYKNNIRTGTAKVTLRGTGDYGGTKTCSFKIRKKAYLKNSVKGITLDKTSLSFYLQDRDEKKMLVATITPEDASKEISDPTVIWSTSDSSVATVETVSVQKADPEGSARNDISVTGLIHAKKPGSVTVTAITRNGNKRAQCTVAVNMPVLKEAGQTISGKTGETYQLSFVGNENHEMDTDGIEYESDNPKVVSVDEKGLLSLKKIGTATIHVYLGSRDYTQECYVVVEEDEIDPTDSRVLTYRQAEGCTNDTPAINKLLRDWEWNPDRYDYMYLPEGVYRIDAVPHDDNFGGIVLTDNQNLVMSPNARIEAIGNSSKNYQVIFAFGRKNITISGGKIVGERDAHTGSDGEWGHGISILGCSNVHIRDVEISQCWGDGIYLGLYDSWDQNGDRIQIFSSGVAITKCNLHNNRRNNLSITDADHVTVENCQFHYAKGTDPQFGIDIEPNTQKHTCEAIIIRNSSFQGNAKASMGIMTAAKDITLENCTLDGDFINWAGKNVVLKNTTIKGEINDHAGGIKYR